MSFIEKNTPRAKNGINLAEERALQVVHADNEIENLPRERDLFKIALNKMEATELSRRLREGPFQVNRDARTLGGRAGKSQRRGREVYGCDIPAVDFSSAALAL